MQRLIELCGGDREVAALIELGLQHEQQHQELLLMDIKNVLWCNPLYPSYLPVAPPAPRNNHGRSGLAAAAVRAIPVADWVCFEGGLVEIGANDAAGSHAVDHGSFHFDNEAPRHKHWLEPFSLADRLVTCGEWLQFMTDGGYDDPRLWLSDGWHTAQIEEWQSPLYWQRDGGGWTVFTLQGLQPIDPAEPVVHVSHYEADAFARWAGARLPTEEEWEYASATVIGSNDFARSTLHPVPADEAAGLKQMFGDVWEWTSSAYLPYPRFAPANGAVGEYNGKFMSGQMVLRGGACVTPQEHIRPTYRNYFYPAQRWMFSGVRLARH